MTRIRSIKPEFFSSPSTADCSYKARLLFIAMWTLADDWGVGEANPKQLAAYAFPFDEISSKEIPCLCKEINSSFNVVFFEVRGRSYFEILNWDEHQITQRRAARRHPTHEQADRILYAQVKPSIQEPPNLDKENLCNDKENTSTEQGNRGTGEQGNIDIYSAKITDEKFTEFWQAFPPERKRNKKGCAKKFTQAVKNGVEPETIITAAEKYRDDPNREPQFTVNPYTWLREERWDSGALPPRATQTTLSKQQQALAQDMQTALRARNRPEPVLELEARQP